MKTIENKFPSKLVALAALPLVALALTLVVGAFTQRAAATPPPGGGSTGSSTNIIAVGAFTPAPVDSSSPITHVAFAAQTIGKNSNVAGYVVEQTSIGTISGPVTCLTVGGMNNNQARIQWTVMHSDITGVNKGTSRQLDVTDMGEPVMGVSLDKFSDEGECDPGTYCMTNCCECDMTPGGSQPIMNGNIVVKSSTTM